MSPRKVWELRDKDGALIMADRIYTKCLAHAKAIKLEGYTIKPVVVNDGWQAPGGSL